MKIYVASPYTIGDVAQNVRRVLLVADQLMNKGHSPYVPHLSHFQHLVCPRPYQDWLDLDFEWLKVCDCVLRLEGESKGADQEVELAKSLGIKVIYNIEDICDI